jgi:hypothetical protein
MGHDLNPSRPGFFQPSSPGLAQDSKINAPKPEFRIGDGDVEMIYIVKNKLMLVNQTDDPVFSSHAETTESFEGGAMELYLADEVVTPVACVQQVSY